MSDNAMMYGQGLFSARPAAATAGDGHVYFATDTGNLYRSNGSAWTLIGATAGGGTPSGSAGGTLGGTYPNPTVNTDGATLETSSSALRVKALGITDSHVAAANKDGTTSTPSLRTLGTGAAQAAAGNDSRLSDSRAPNGSAGGVLDGNYPNPGLAAGVAGAGLAETSDVLSVNVDGSTIEINTDTLRVKAGGIGANELASTAVTPTTYGDATHVGQFTVDADGRITAASAVSITATGSATTYRSAVTADAPAYWWHMDDASGTTMAATNGGVNGTYNGATVGGTGPGFSGGGVAPSFDGTNDYAQAAINLSSTGDLVVEFWLKWTAYATDDDLALEYGAGGLVAGFYVDPNGATGSFDVNIQGAATGRLTKFARPSAGIWHHYVIFLRRTIDAIMYVDGALWPVTATSGTLQSGNFGNFTLNVMSRNATTLFGAGSMSELAIYTAWPTRGPFAIVHAAAAIT